MRGSLRIVAALVGGGVLALALWTATGPGFPVSDGVRTVLVWTLAPGWLVAPGERYEFALLADAGLYAVILWLLLWPVFRRRGGRRY